MDCCCWWRKKPNLGATTDRNGGKPAPAAEPLSPDLWDRAFKALQKDKDNAKLLKSYEEILRKNTGESNTTALATVGSSVRQQQMSLVVKKKLEEMDKAKWKFHVGGKEIVVRQQIDRLVKGVLFAKDFVSAGVSLSSDPHAGLAWAGVCMLLPLLLNPSTEYQALLKGLDCISNIICQFTVLERLYRQQGLWKDPNDIEVVTNFEANVTKLYSHVLVYQAKVVCRSTLKAVEITRDMLKLDDWENLLSDIESSERTCKGFTGVMDSAKLSRGFEDMDLHQEELLKLFALQGKDIDLVLTEVKALRIEQEESRKNDKESEFLKSLYASISENGSSGTGLEYESNKNINPEPVRGTCEWFLEDERYQSWLQGKGSRILWVSAGPGCGKSVLSRLLVDKLKSTYSKDSHTVCYFFFKDISEKRRSIASALCAILHQLFTNRTSLLEHAMDEFRDKGPAFATDFGILWKIFIKVAADPNSGDIICVLDALDECERSRLDGQDGQAMLIRKLTELYSGPGSNDMASMKLKIMVTSRPYFQIERLFSDLTRDLPTIRFDDDEEMKNLTADIDLVIKDRVSGMRWLKEHVKEALVHRLTSTKNRTYLWVHLIFPSIENSIEKKERELLQLISTIPSTVEDAYEKILKQSPDAKKAKKLLHIVVAAVRPLTLTEMHIAMAIEDDKMSEEELSKELDEDDNFPSTVTNLCGLFVRIEHQNIYLVHQTAKDFLQAPLKPTLGQKNDIPSDLAAWKHSLEPRESHLILAKICISYLLFALESDPLIIDNGAANNEVRKEVGQYLKQHYFLDYSAKYWATHFRGANSEPALLESVMNLCDTQSQRFLTWFQVYWTTQYSPCPKQLTQILVGSYFGLVTLVQQLLKSESIDPDSKDDNDRTPLSWAAGKGHKAVVESLLEAEGVSLDSTDRSCRTPLSWAVGNGQEGVVPLLLKKGADLRIRDKKGRAALHWAVDNGQESIIRLLLEEADNMAVKNEFGRAKLYSTTDFGYKELVQKLLDDGINFTMILKVERGDEVVAGLLVDAGADIESKDGNGRTILLQAARRGEAVAKFLLQKGADIKAKDEDGMTVVHHATTNVGNESLLRLLLEKGADFKAKDINGKTALHVAAEYGDVVAARFLVGLQDLKVHEKDIFGQTPFSIAAVRGNEDIAQLLLRQDGVDPESEDASGRTALLCAASGWILEKGGFGAKTSVSYDKWGPVVRLLLGRDDVKPNATAKNGKTALIYAAEEGNTWVAQALLAKDSVRADIKDEEGMTALFYAAKTGHEEMARLLLPKKGADIEIETALQLAARNGHVVLVQLLLDHLYGKSNIDEASKAEKWLATAQIRGAVKSGDEEAVSLLLEKGADLEAEDEEGSTALFLAIEEGNEKMAKLLLDNNANMKTKNRFGQTALHLAATGGHSAVAECLLEKKAALAAIDAIDSSGDTALSLAAYSGAEPILRLLLEKGADTNAGEPRKGWTALQWAAWFGYKELIRLLVKNGAHMEAKSFENRDVPWEGSTALCLAAWNYYMEGGDNLAETVQLLAEMGADVKVASLDGSTPLRLVALRGHKALIQLLVEKGARIDAKDFEGRTALQCAAEGGHGPAVQLLLELGANLVNVEELQRSEGVAQKDFNAAVQAIKEWPGVVSSMA